MMVGGGGWWLWWVVVAVVMVVSSEAADPRHRLGRRVVGPIVARHVTLGRWVLTSRVAEVPPPLPH